MKPKSALYKFPLASAIATLLASSSVHAGQIWDGGSIGPGDNNWSTDANWDGDLDPIFANPITFTGNIRNVAVNDLAADSVIGGINFTNDGSGGFTNAFTLSGNRITLGGNIVTTTSSSAITDIISLNMILNGNRTITTNASHNLSISGSISQTGGARTLTKDGAGTLTLSSANVYTGNTTVNAGILTFSGLGNIYNGLDNSATVSVASGAQIVASSTAFNVLGFGSGATWTVAGTINSSGGGPQTLPATVNLNNGTLTGVANASFGTFTTNPGYTNTLTANGASNLISSANFGMAGTATLALSTPLGTDALSVTAPLGLSGQGGVLTKSGLGTVTLSATNVYTGGTTLNQGTLSLSTNGTLGASTGTLTVNNNNNVAPGNATILNLATAINTAVGSLSGTIATPISGTNTITINTQTGRGFTVNQTTPGTYAGVIAGAGSFTKTGSATLTLQGTNTYTAGSTISAGSLQLGNGGTTGALTGTASITNNANLTINRSNAFSQATDLANRAITGTGSFTQAGGGNTTLSVANSYTGNTTVSAGTLTFSGLGNIYVGSGNSAIVSVAAGAQIVASSSANNVLGLGAAATWTVAGTINSSGGGAQTLPGIINLNNGTLTGVANGSFGTFTTNPGHTTTLTANGASNLISSANFGMPGNTLALSTPLGTDALSVTAPLGLSTSQTGALTKSGLGTVTLSATNPYAGATTINAGSLRLGNGSTTGSLTGTASITNNANLTVNRSNAFTQVTDLNNKAIGGTGSFTQAGGGTTTLSLTNTYSGATTVSSGTLIVNGSISTSVLTTVQTGATLGGSGTVGALTINSGGFFSPGNSPGITTVNGNYTQNGQLNMELTGLTAGTQHDQVNVIGSATLGGLLNITSFTGSYALNDLIFILLNDSADSITGTFTGLAQGATVTTHGGFDWQISYIGNSGGNTFIGGNDIVLMAVPEPRAALLGGIGMLMLLRRRRTK
jgi:fibronectin-binding autotransporter adhesin